MATTTSINITGRDVNGDKTQMTVPNINPAATDSDLTYFAHFIKGFSTDTYVGAERVERKELVGSKSTPTIVLSKQPDGSSVDTWGTIDDTQGAYEYIITNSDGKPYIKACTAYTSANIIREKGEGYDLYVLNTGTKDPAGIWDDGGTYYDDNGNELSMTSFTTMASVTDATAKIVVALPETDNFAAIETTFYVKY